MFPVQPDHLAIHQAKYLPGEPGTFGKHRYWDFRDGTADLLEIGRTEFPYKAGLRIPPRSQKS